MKNIIRFIIGYIIGYSLGYVFYQLFINNHETKKFYLPEEFELRDKDSKFTIIGDTLLFDKADYYIDMQDDSTYVIYDSKKLIWTGTYNDSLGIELAKQQD